MTTYELARSRAERARPRHRWIARWRPLAWRVTLRHWTRVDGVDFASGVVIDLRLHAWIWILALLWALASRVDFVREFGGTRFYAARARLGLPRPHELIGWCR